MLRDSLLSPFMTVSTRAYFEVDGPSTSRWELERSYFVPFPYRAYDANPARTDSNESGSKANCENAHPRPPSGLGDDSVSSWATTVAITGR